MKLVFPIVFSFLLVIDLMLGGMILHATGWVFGLPNHDYLYAFSIVPIVFLLLHHFGISRLNMSASLVFIAVLGFGGVVYLFAGLAQLWRMPFIPFGLITFAMGIILVSETYSLAIKCTPINIKKIVITCLSLFVFLLISRVHDQPWVLVRHLPNVKDVSLTNTDLSNVNLNLVTFNNVNLDGVNFSRASLVGVKFIDSSLNQANFDKAIIKNSLFTSTSLQQTQIQSDWIYQTTFENVDLRGAIFHPRGIGRTYIKNSKLCGISFNDQMDGIYDWQGSIIDHKSIPTIKGHGCCGNLEDLVVVDSRQCN